MNDYKELIGKLREIEKYGNGKDDRFIGALIDTKTAKDAADALEQIASYTDLCEKECEAAGKYIEKLEKDRDKWKTLGELANKRAEDYREMRRQRDEAIKERDAAKADFMLLARETHGLACKFCKYDNYPYCKWYEEHTDEEHTICNGKRFERRYVKEAEHDG